MAERRMFAKRVVDSDAFLDLPISARLLYYDLGMICDDDGLTNQVKKTMRMNGTKNSDLEALIDTGFIIMFNSGIVAIRDWNLNNQIQKDRYHPSTFIKEKSLLNIDENKMYTVCIQDVSNLDTEISIDKSREEKISVDKVSIVQPRIGQTSIDQSSSGEILCLDTQDRIPYKEIIDHLNLRLNSKYQYTTKKTQQSIHARWMEGYRLEDFKVVIDKKVHEWIGTDMETYLRPETLFGTKFESYLNQIVRKRKVTTKDIADKMDWEGYMNE